MKKNIIGGMIAVLMSISQMLHAQETLYLSNLGQSPSGSYEVGSDSWYAVELYTGNNAGGYILNSIQLAMEDATGDPNGFTVMLYNAVIGGAVIPGSSLGALIGSTDPDSAGNYTYTPSSSLPLSPNTYYYVVLTSGIKIVNGAYEWSEGGNYNQNGNWLAFAGPAYSGDGSHWNFVPGYPQFALTATPIPESSTEMLLGLGGILLLGFGRWKAKAV